MKYIFILGKNPELSIAEIKAVFPVLQEIGRGKNFLVAEGEIDSIEAIARLGGTIKIGEVIGSQIDQEKIVEVIENKKGEGKAIFGFSFYGIKPVFKIGMEIKRILREKGINSRLVTSREETLSSVIVKKEKCLDFLVLPGFIGLTITVQDFEEYGIRDFGRPRSDNYSGMLPPKAAKMMINLSGANLADKILDPFCGSGTILTEAAALGFGDLVGSDNSAKAVEDTKENLEWTIKKIQDTRNKEQKNSKFPALPVGRQIPNSNIFQCDAQELSRKLAEKSIDAIITEPYLGPPIRGGESEREIEKIMSELGNLYLASFHEFKKVLKPDGKVVMIFPEWHLDYKIYRLDLASKIEDLGFKRQDQGDLIYKREGQKVWRIVSVWNIE